MPEFEAMEDIEKQARVSVQVDGSMIPTTAGWKEAKLAVVVSEAHHHRGEAGICRGEVTEANYAATMGDMREFSSYVKKLIPERIGFKERNAGKQGPEVVWTADGAAWIWKMQQRLCPQAIQILDWSHAVSHGVQCGYEVLGEDSALCALWEARIRELLWQGNIQLLLQELAECALAADTKVASEALRKLQGYYKQNKKRMNYQQHREAGRLIGSGLVESGHRHVLQTRMKRAGQHWSPLGAERMARLRAVYKTVGPQQFYHSVIKSTA